MLIPAGWHWIVVTFCLWMGVGLIVALGVGRAASLGEHDDERRRREP